MGMARRLFAIAGSATDHRAGPCFPNSPPGRDRAVPVYAESGV